MNCRLLLCIIVILWPIANLLGGECIWQKEIACDSNLGCFPGTVSTDVKGNKLVILGATIRNDVGEENLVLWEIDPNANILHQTQIGATPKGSATIPLFHRFRDIFIKNDNQITILGDFDVNTPSSLLTISRGGGNKSIKSITKSRNKYENILISRMDSTNDSVVLAGRQENNGLLIKLDALGNEVWKKTFDIGETEVFTDVAVESDEIYVAGFTAPIRAPNKMGFGSEVQNFLLLYDTNGQLIKENYFEGVFSTKLPQVARLKSGTVLVAYDKSKNVTAVDLNVRAYSSDLKPLWETQMVKAGGGGPPGCFRIVAVSGDRAFVGVVFNGGELVIAECASDGKVIERWTLGKTVGPHGGLHLAELDRRVYAIFGTPSYGNFQNVKTMILAFPIK